MSAPEQNFGNTGSTALASVQVLPPEVSMDRNDAERLCQELEFHYQKLVQYYSDNIRSRLIRLRDGKGYKSLGYESMNQLCQERFQESKSEIYRQLEAGDVEQSMDLPLGTLPTSQAIALKPAPPTARATILSGVKASGGVTAGKLEAAVNNYLDTTDLPPKSVIYELYGQYGTVTPTPSRNRPNAFTVKRSHPESFDERSFQGLKAAWDCWNDLTFQAKVSEALEKFGPYTETAVPVSCLNCLHRDLQHIGASDSEIYCNKKHTGIGVDRVIGMATTGCWKGEDGDLNPESNDSIAELDRTPGVSVMFRSGACTYEGKAMTVKVKYINNNGIISYKEVSLSEVLSGLVNQ